MPLNLREVIRNGVYQLTQSNSVNPEFSMRVLVSHILGLRMEELSQNLDRPLQLEEIEQIQQLTDRRANGETINRIVGSCEFWRMRFDLNEDTLEPRPDSEALIEAVIRHTKSGVWKFLPNSRKLFKRSQPIRVLDLGTGTGCLLLSLLSEFPNATGLGIDIASGAVHQARSNAARLHFSERAQFQINNWLDGIIEKFDIIVSNPPYIPTSDIDKLKPNVRNFDPYKALNGGDDGLEVYRKLVPQMMSRLKPTGLIVLEIGHKAQAEYVAALCTKAAYSHISIHKDFRRRDRCITAINNIT